jgi:hypothetical protein
MSYRHRVYREDSSYWVSEFHDDATRTVTFYDEQGAVTGSRPYTTEEIATATATAAAELAAANEASLRSKIDTALTTNATYLAITSPTNAQNTAQVKALTRQVNGLIKLTLSKLDDVTGT